MIEGVDRDDLCWKIDYGLQQMVMRVFQRERKIVNEKSMYKVRNRLVEEHVVFDQDTI